MNLRRMSALLWPMPLLIVVGCSSTRTGTWQFVHLKDGSLAVGTHQYEWRSLPFGYVSREMTTNYHQYAQSTVGRGWLRVFLDGGTREWFSEGYLGGRPHGRTIVWHPNGAPLRIMDYDHGDRCGTWMEWDARGRLVSLTDSDRDACVATLLCWWPNGRLKHRASRRYPDAASMDWHSGTFSGVSRTWSDSGNLERNVYYVDGIPTTNFPECIRSSPEAIGVPQSPEP